jgi:hypothetical protein
MMRADAERLRVNGCNARDRGDAELSADLSTSYGKFTQVLSTPLPMSRREVFRHCKRAVRHDVTTPDVPGIDGTPFSPHRLGNVTFDSAD